MEGTKLGKYEIRATLGRGAMGTVYEAWDPAIERKVAIKTVRLPTGDDAEAKELLERFRREAQAAGRLNSPQHRRRVRLRRGATDSPTSSWSSSRDDR